LLSIAASIAASAALAATPVGGNVTRSKLGSIEETANVVTDVTVPTVVADEQGASDLAVTVTPVLNGEATTQYKIKVAAPAGFDPTSLQEAIDDLCDSTNSLQTAVTTLDTTKANKATTLAGYGISDAKIANGIITLGSQTITPLTSFTETDPTVPSWAKDANKPSYKFSEINSTPTTLAGYGITDAKIENGKISIGGQSITPLTSFTETDPTIKAWAKADNKPTYTASEVGAVPTTRKVNNQALSADISLTASDVGAIANTAVSGITWNNAITGEISTLHETIVALNQLITALGGTPPSGN
jgi:hypothetical protein